MFGGLAFLVGGNMAIAASGQGGVLVRVDPSESDAIVDTTPAELAVMRAVRCPVGCAWRPSTCAPSSSSGIATNWVRHTPGLVLRASAVQPVDAGLDEEAGPEEIGPERAVRVGVGHRHLVRRQAVVVVGPTRRATGPLPCPTVPFRLSPRFAPMPDRGLPTQSPTGRQIQMAERLTSIGPGQARQPGCRKTAGPASGACSARTAVCDAHGARHPAWACSPPRSARPPIVRSASVPMVECFGTCPASAHQGSRSSRRD